MAITIENSPLKPNRPESDMLRWMKVDEARYWQMLEILPHAEKNGNGFLVGEPVRDDGQGRPMFTAFMERGLGADLEWFESLDPVTVQTFRHIKVADIAPIWPIEAAAKTLENALTAASDAAFECGEWGDDSSNEDESYEDVQAASAKASQRVLNLARLIAATAFEQGQIDMKTNG